MPVIAYHLVLSCYGFWLPNDPRVSWSGEVTAFNLRPFGEATTVNTKASRAGVGHDRALRRDAKAALAHPPVKFTGLQARAVASGFGEVVAGHGLTVNAAAVMPDHAHLVIRRHTELEIEAIARRLKAKATQRLNKEGLGIGRSPWARGHWSVYLRDTQAVARAIAYVEQNPVKAGMKPQRWRFLMRQQSP